VRPLPRQRRWTALAAAAALAVACGKEADPEPRPRSVEPAQGLEGAAVAIRIEGEGLEPHVLTDYGDQGGSAVDARFQAWLGATRLRDVRPSGDGALLATVPEDLPAGTYDLAVADPAGKRATLPGAYRALAPTDAGVLVASFRFDPVAAQVARAPFAITVTALDAAGRVVTGFTGTAAISDRTGALVPSTIGPFAWGVWTGPVEVRAARGADALTASDGRGHAGASNDFAVAPAPAARLSFTSPAVDALAGACAGPVTVAVEDLYGAPTAAASPLDVTVSGGAVEVYADPACAVAATGATLAAGATSASVYVRSTLAVPFTLAAAAAALDPAAQSGLVRPAAPARLVFTTAPQTLAAGDCSAAAAVRAEDAFGNVSPVRADTAVALSSTAAAGLSFHGAAACAAAPVGAVTLPAGGSAATFWFRATAAEAVTVAATGAGVAGAGTQGATILPAAPTSLAFVTASQAVAAATCSGVATVEARDAFGNAAPATAGTLVSLAVAPAAAFTFHLDAACADAPVSAVLLDPGATRTSFRFRATAVGAYDVTATGAGLAGAATQRETIGPAAADRLVFATAPQAVTAGSCSAAVTVEARDLQGNVAPVAALTSVALSAAPGTGFAFFDAAGCGGTPVTSVDLAAGASSATFWFRGTAAGTVTVTATGAGIPTAATQAETILSVAPDRLVFTSAPQTVTAGSCSSAVLETRDVQGNPTPAAALTPVALSAAPGTGFAFFDSAGCGGAPVSSVDLAAGASSTTFWFRGTAAGGVTVTATVAGTPAATQVETVEPGPADHFAFDPVTSPWMRTRSFAVRVQAMDAFGNPAPAFTDTATLGVVVPQPPNGAGATLSCTAGCASGTVTAAFVAGAWTGSVAVDWADADPQKLGVSVRAAGSGAWASVTGASGAFDVVGTVRSAPTARATASPLVVRENDPVTFDASGSTDYQTPAAGLEVSWDFQGIATAAPGSPTAGAPWTAWTTTQTATNVYALAGTYEARVAVRDADGDVGLGSVTVIVLPAGSAPCVVTTGADVDDGATACGSPGPDGVLSLAEALRLAPNGTTITFASPVRISGTGAYTVARDDITLVAPAGTILDGKSLSITGNRFRVLGLELANQTTAVAIGNKRVVTLEDCNLHDMPGITVGGTLTLTRVRMANCVGRCVTLTDASNSDTLTVRHSAFLGGPGAVGIDIAQCRANRVALVSQSNVFAGLATGVRFASACIGWGEFQNDSFASNGTGIAFSTGASANHVLRNTIFSGHTTAAASCGAATFASRDRHLLYQNASDGCLGGDAGTISGQDPLYVFASGGDYRVGLASPAVDGALDLGLFLLPQFPAAGPRFLGAGPDRGGRESW
jgi:hypothetical protein